MSRQVVAGSDDVLVLAGDVGAGDRFGECLARFADLPCLKAAVPGNHDVWVLPDDVRGDSLHLYRELLPATCAAHRVHYLDQAPLVLPEADLFRLLHAADVLVTVESLSLRTSGCDAN